MTDLCLITAVIINIYIQYDLTLLFLTCGGNGQRYDDQKEDYEDEGDKADLHLGVLPPHFFLNLFGSLGEHRGSLGKLLSLIFQNFHFGPPLNCNRDSLGYGGFRLIGLSLHKSHAVFRWWVRHLEAV